MRIFFVIILSVLCFHAKAQHTEMEPLFNKKNLDGWDTFLPSKGINADPDSVFRVRDGVLHISGKEFGYIATTGVFNDFHLVTEFKWGEAKYPPRENEKRDSGILYFVASDVQDKIWPKSVECQIQEGDVGDFWLIDSATIQVKGKRTPPADYFRVEKEANNEYANGEWNSVEIIARDGKLKHIVNGQLVNEGEAPNIKGGRILIQSEGAEIYYRKVDLKKL